MIHMGGVLATVGDGVRAGLKELGVEEGKQITVESYDLKGEVKAAEELAHRLERDQVKLIFTGTSPITDVVMKATSRVPIVFAVGTDPVAQGLVQSFAKPGGRLTGIQYLARDLTGKRLEVLKEFLAGLRQVVTFYNPESPVSMEGARLGREEAQRRNIKIIERHVNSTTELTAALNALKPRQFDAYLYIADPMVASQVQGIIDAGRAKKLPTMFHDRALVDAGALASYGQNYFEIGRRSAKYIQKILAGSPPADLRVETIEDVELAFNLKTAKEIGITIPPNTLARAARVIK